MLPITLIVFNAPRFLTSVARELFSDYLDLGEKTLIPEATMEDLEALLAAARFSEMSISKQAKNRLHELLPLLTSDDAERVGKGAIQHLNELCVSDETSLGLHAIVALAMIGNASSLPVLRRLASDRRFPIRFASTKSAAKGAMEAIKLRLSESIDGSELLRASLASPEPKTLLRPVIESDVDAPSVLVRSSKKSE